jgi:uncharacterized membrane protein YqiK
METLTQRKLAEEQRKTYEVQQMAQTQRQELVRATAMADIQQEMVKSEQGVTIAQLEANAQIQQATGEAEGIRLRAAGEAEAIRATGQAKAETYRAGVEALGTQGYTSMQLMQIVGDRHVRLIPDVLVNGSNGSSGVVDGLLTMLLWNQSGKSNNHQISSDVPKEPHTNGTTDGTMAKLDEPPLIPPDLLVNKPNNQSNRG